jgi:hypothetical protein
LIFSRLGERELATQSRWPFAVSAVKFIDVGSMNFHVTGQQFENEGFANHGMRQLCSRNTGAKE